jgi:MarR family 2-MHQ and catechol resistance regulon transcriptional repressor
MTAQRTEHPAIHTWLVLMKAHRTLSRHATRSIEALDMCFSDFAILEAHKGPQSARELGRRIELTSGSMTTAIVARSASSAGRPPDRPPGPSFT